MLFGLSAILIGVVRIIDLLHLSGLDMARKMPYLGLLGIPFIFRGSYIQSKNDPEARRKVMLVGIIILIGILFAIISILL